MLLRTERWHVYLYAFLLVDHDLWSTLHEEFYVSPHTVKFFVNLYVSLLVDHVLWSTLHALYVTTHYYVPRLFVHFLVGRPQFVVYPPRIIYMSL